MDSRVDPMRWTVRSSSNLDERGAVPNIIMPIFPNRQEKINLSCQNFYLCNITQPQLASSGQKNFGNKLLMFHGGAQFGKVLVTSHSGIQPKHTSIRYIQEATMEEASKKLG